MRDSGTRLVGLDVARCLALLGMVATHVLDPFGPGGELAPGQWLAGGRASALFALLAGVTLALGTGARTPVRGRERVARSAAVAVRALLVAALGLALGVPDSGLAVILAYYGVLFLLGLPFVGLRARPLLLLAAAWAVVVPVLSHVVRPHLPERGFDNPTFGQLVEEPGRLLAELLLTGYYPALPWLAYLLAGMALGRLDLRDRATQARLAVGGLVLAVAATVASRLLTATDAVGSALLRGRPEPDVDRLLDGIATGTAGTTPTGAGWQWLLVVAPHTGTPFDLAQTTGSALLVVGACLLVLGRTGPFGTTVLQVLFGAGTMTLTLYSLHVLLRTEGVWPPDDADGFAAHVLVLLAIGAAYAAAGWRGPLERAVGAASAAVGRAVGRALARGAAPR